MTSRRLSSAEITAQYLARIAALDRVGPMLRAVIELNPEAEAIAREMDRERRLKGARGPLHGVPVLIKDNLDTHDRMSTTAGSLALVGSTPRRDAFVVRQLRDAGAVILGKTNLSEWANFRSTRSTSGWSGRGGQTRNPYALERNPSGSSSGSGVAVAANLCAVAVGTETDGSILSPSSFNGIVGLKPTVGLVSRTGIIPIAHSQDTAGPMARTVTDAAMLLDCLAGADPEDPATQSGAPRATVSYTQGLDPSGLRSARLGVARGLFGSHPEVIRLMETVMEEIQRAGATLIDPVDLPTFAQLGDSEFELMLYEFKTDLNAYLSGLGPTAPVGSLQELIEFNERNRAREMPHFGQEIFLKAQAKGPLTEPAYLAALEKTRRLSRSEGLDAALGQHRLDAIIAPTTGPAHVTDWSYGDRDTGGSTSPAAISGYPSITVPAGFIDGLPVGISFFGGAYAESKLIKLAFAFEQTLRARRAPRFLSRAAG